MFHTAYSPITSKGHKPATNKAPSTQTDLASDQIHYTHSTWKLKEKNRKESQRKSEKKDRQRRREKKGEEEDREKKAKEQRTQHTERLAVSTSSPDRLLGN